MVDQHEKWTGRNVRTFAQVSRDIPLSWQAEKLYHHAWRLEHQPRADTAGVNDALAVLALSTALYYDARRDGVRQALRVGATVPEVARALGIAIDEAGHLAQRLAEQDRFLEQYFQQRNSRATDAP
ncbi:hypothetical protein CLM62_47135 [Streptomyces sp. SA15]|uniref:hypothetical protein n=1 Tax=Streptomyces sp. SA15 TaxID=934019 RepID=UPI000BAF3E73|nr:hypothetical protein [Streptomyces sp. SA15]PAZ09337.1 hypothetical protein CLM62_47135 [Streptomyces sp. SA15]